MFEELEDLQAHMYEHDDELEETSKNERATMIEKSSSKGTDNQMARPDESMESEDSELEVEEEVDEDEEEDITNNENKEQTCSVLSTDIVTVSVA